MIKHKKKGLKCLMSIWEISTLTTKTTLTLTQSLSQTAAKYLDCTSVLNVTNRMNQRVIFIYNENSLLGITTASLKAMLLFQPPIWVSSVQSEIARTRASRASCGCCCVFVCVHKIVYVCFLCVWKQEKSLAFRSSIALFGFVVAIAVEPYFRLILQ